MSTVPSPSTSHLARRDIGVRPDGIQNFARSLAFSSALSATKIVAFGALAARQKPATRRSRCERAHVEKTFWVFSRQLGGGGGRRTERGRAQSAAFCWHTRLFGGTSMQKRCSRAPLSAVARAHRQPHPRQRWRRPRCTDCVAVVVVVAVAVAVAAAAEARANAPTRARARTSRRSPPSTGFMPLGGRSDNARARARSRVERPRVAPAASGEASECAHASARVHSG